MPQIKVMSPNGNVMLVDVPEQEEANQDNRQAVVVNFFAGPGSGKSSMCADVFAKLKWKDVDCEMVREYAKEKVWEGTEIVLENQVYVFAKQLHRQFYLENKVDVMITDSPVLLSILYDGTKNEKFHALIQQQFDSYDNLNFFVKRVKKYNPNGRMQTEAEAHQKDEEMKAILTKMGVTFLEVDGSPDGACAVSEIVYSYLQKKKGSMV